MTAKGDYSFTVLYNTRNFAGGNDNFDVAIMVIVVATHTAYEDSARCLGTDHNKNSIHKLVP